MPVINPRIRFIEKFLARFKSVFSTKHQRTIFKDFIYGMFSDYKRLSLAAIAGNTRTNYQKLQYFFSEANWSAKELIAEAVAKGIPFKSIVTDAWYTSTDLIEFVASKSLSLTAEH